jgi:hypothetical protein
MAVAIEIYKERRVVLLRWRRAGRGDPSASRPEVDDRGSLGPEFGPIVGVMEGRKIKVRLERVLVDPAASLVVKSSDDSAVRVVDPADGKVPAGARADIELEGVSGGDPREAKIEVRFERDDGPILSVLTVRCFVRRRVRITPHLCTIAPTGGGAGVASTADVASIMTHVRAIWSPCGVDFTVGATQNDNITLATAGVVSDNPFPGELATLLGTSWVPNTINVYFVGGIGTGNTLGYGFSRPSSVTFGTGNPGIILADQAGGTPHDTPWAGNDLAHEVGHFFQLWHPNNLQPPNERQDTWCRRMLMHNHNTMVIHNNWKDDVGYGALGGSARRGALVTHKDLTAITTDGEVRTARAAIVAGPY